MTDHGASSYHRFLRGDATAVEKYVQTYGDPLVRFAYCILNDSFAAEDVMEDTFATLIVKHKLFKEQEQMKAYLFKIARNKCMDVLRTRKKYVYYDDPSCLESNLSQILTEDPESGVMLSERHRLLYRSMQQLPNQYREVLDLVYFEGFSIADASNILHLNRKQVYNLLARAKVSLKEILEKEGINDENL